MKIKGQYTSVWDLDSRDRGYEVTTDCTIDLETGMVDAEASSDEDSESCDILARESVAFQGRQFAVEDEKVTDIVTLRSYAKLVAGKQMAEGVVPEYGGKFSAWTPCGPGTIGLWEYADLTVGEKVIRVGVSGGGVVSLAGHPFDPEGKVVDDPKTLRAALSALIGRSVAAASVAGVAVKQKPSGLSM